MLQLLAKFLKALNSDASPNQISAAFVLGMLMGLTPLWSLHNLVLLLMVCLLRVNLSSFLLSFAVFSAIAYVLDPLFVSCGESLLASDGLQATWTQLYQSDFWRLAHFNNTLTVGSVVISLLSAIPLFVVSRLLVIKYRKDFVAMAQKSRLVQWLKATRFYDVYETVSKVRGGLSS